MNALVNPYNVSLFMNEDSTHYVNVNFVLATADEGAVFWQALGDDVNTFMAEAVMKTTTVGSRPSTPMPPRSGRDAGRRIPVSRRKRFGNDP